VSPNDARLTWSRRFATISPPARASSGWSIQRSARWPLHRPGEPPRFLRSGDTLRDEVVVPGFVLEIAALFAPTRSGAARYSLRACRSPGRRRPRTSAVSEQSICGRGVHTVEAESGDRALDRALDGSFSCIVLDVMLPGRDGFSVVEELRRRSVVSHPCSCHGPATSWSRACAGWNAAPTTPHRAVRSVRAPRTRVRLIRRQELRHKDSTLKAARWCSIPSRRAHIRRPGLIDLSPREFSLSSSSCATPIAPSRASRIAEAVWNYSLTRDKRRGRVRHTCARTQRRQQSPPIRTVRGVRLSDSKRHE